jgi:nucleotide-binding universal stress UspA family protein
LNKQAFPDQQLVRWVFHPSDFSEASQNAFAHALALSLLRETELTILNVGGKGPSEEVWTSFPGVRPTLERWGLLEEGSPRSAVFEKLSLRVKKVSVKGSNALSTILKYLGEDPADLIVLATRHREGVPGWLTKKVSTPLARKSGTMTLFVPEGTKGMVDPEDGRVSLKRILVPVDRRPNPQGAIEIAARTAKIVGQGTVEITLLHIGDSGKMPELHLPEDPSCSWNKVVRKGDAVEQIIGTANELSADLIVMMTEGHQGILDALRGNTTERVVNDAPCPLLAVPLAWVDQVTRKSWY